jgi:hypothetical protein
MKMNFSTIAKYMVIVSAMVLLGCTTRRDKESEEGTGKETQDTDAEYRDNTNDEDGDNN